MKWIAIASRVVLGLLYLMAVISFFFKLGGEQPSLNGDAGNFTSSIANSGFLTIVKVLEAIGAVLLLSGQFVRLAALIVLPVTVNILLFHLLMAPFNLFIPILMIILNAFLLVYYAEDLKPVLKRQ